MSANRNSAAFLQFLDYLGQKGLIPTATAASRKATANKVLAILSQEEAADVLALDLDEVMQRFQNLNAQNYTPESLQTYRSRMRTAFEDFRAYCQSPHTFKPAGQAKTKTKSGNETSPKAKTQQAPQPPAPPPAPTHPTGAALPIPLRANLTVQVIGLPYDLTKAEAQRLANIILAHAVVE